MNNGTSMSEERKHKAPRYNTIDYHSDVVKKRQKITETSSKVVVTSHCQTPITSFLVEAEPHEQPIQFKIEEYFKVPPSKKGFNLLSLRRSFHSIKTNVNIVGLIKKNVLNNNIVKWTVQSKLRSQRTRRSVTRIDNENAIPQTNSDSSASYTISGDYHRLYVEDVILLNIGDPIKILIPDKAVKKKGYSFDRKFISCVTEIDNPITQIGGDNNRYHVLSCVIKSCPNRNEAISGIDRISFQNGFTGNQNFGCLIQVIDSDHIPLLKWRDVINGKRDGLQVSYFSVIVLIESINIKYITYTAST